MRRNHIPYKRDFNQISSVDTKRNLINTDDKFRNLEIYLEICYKFKIGVKIK